MCEPAFSLKPVSKLLKDGSGEPRKFFVPDYQRGYRWTKDQVRELLDDILEFINRPGSEKEKRYYCLQPLVLRPRNGGEFEVVDGQQRLMTLRLILRHLNSILEDEIQLFEISYQTRPTLLSFLKKPTQAEADQNADYYHIWNAIEEIKKWFEEDNRKDKAGVFRETLLDRTKVIWAEIGKREESVKVFTRLNDGRISLTDAELIRALFLKNMSDDEQSYSRRLQLGIAYDWDFFERALQANDFWCFVSNKADKCHNRIGILFETIIEADKNKETKKKPDNHKDDPYRVFRAYSEKMNGSGAAQDARESEWKKVRETFQLLEEWFRDREYFHMVGYLVNEGEAVSEIRSWYDGCTKLEFKNRLRQEIFEIAIAEKPKPNEQISDAVASRLEDANYGSPGVKSLLLLFNLATLLSNDESNLRFQFNSYKEGKWDIEHIHPVAPEKLPGAEERREWLDACERYLKLTGAKQELLSKVDEYRNGPDTTHKFEELYRSVAEHFGKGSSEEDNDSISNLALLDSSTNRRIKNSAFPVKRQRILDLDKGGTFVPTCTRNAFLKCYTPDAVNLLSWEEKDRDAYFKNITDTLSNFFAKKEKRS